MKPSPTELAELLQPAQSTRRPRLRIALISGAVVAVILVVIGIRHFGANQQPPSPFTTEPLARGDISLTITATGNLAPTNEVTVGSELSGTVLEVYVDTNDRVTKGQPLAKLDSTKLAQQTAASRATLASAQAKAVQAEATVKEAKADLARQQELKRLSNGKLPSQAELAASEATADRAAADLLAAQAAIGEAQAQVFINESDLGKTIIKSPIDGIVLTRGIEPGQTVAASFTAPELFVIAENLEYMKLDVAIAEADIGRVSQNQNATFTVDAWPSRAYTAKVLKVGYGSEVTDNVVTYETELEVANSDLSLRPGMTATADIRVAESKQVFLVPSAALRFNPETTGPAATTEKKSFVQSLMPMPPRRSASDGKTESVKTSPGSSHIWVLRDGRPEAVEVKIGLADERHTEITADNLTEGQQVIIRAATTSK